MEQEKIIVVGANIKKQVDFEESIEELVNLAKANQFKVVGILEQNIEKVNNAFYIGPGKVEELLRYKEELDVKTIVFNDELTPSQLRNLEEHLACRIMDRTYLILEIFASRAKTKEARIQVEVAMLHYLMPRLSASNANLSQQSGGSGVRNKGSGEKQIDLDKRNIRTRIVELSKELDLIVNQREVKRKQRDKNEFPSVAIVGYTNAGKSTFMNYMVDKYVHQEEKKVFEQDMLFATLETTVRRIELEDKKRFLLSDTVGFVSKLPHDLVKAFRSTLEEAKEADVILNVVDYSSPQHKSHIEVTLDTLQQIGIENVPIITVYNKIDRFEGEVSNTKDEFYISAKSGEGVNELLDEIKRRLFKDYIKCMMLIPYEEGSLISYINEHTSITWQKEEENGILFRLECSKRDYDKYHKFVI